MRNTTLAMRLASAALVGAFGLGFGGAGVASAAASSGGGDDVSLHVMVQPGATAPGASFTDIITVANVGQDGARDVTISVPFDASKVQLLGVQFNQPGAWVTSVTPDAFHADLGEIGSQGKNVQVIASFAELPGFATTSALPTSIIYHYRNSDNDRSHSGTVNTQLLPIEATAASQQVSSSMMVTAGSTVPLNSAIFAPGEAVAVWYNTLDGQTLPLYVRNGRITTEHQRKELMANGTTHYVNNGAYLYADAQGAIAAPLSTSGLEPGAYTLVAHGLNSSATAVVAFQVQ
jgi:hypothetical protein